MTTLIAPRTHDLGGFQVRRAVPTLQARSVGPFVFVDHMGPALFEPGRGIDVRPHPHIGLATVTYLWAGALRHRDTLGSVQDILPGDVNWMTAGRGIAHSERTPPDPRASGHAVHGMQTWVALPKADEEVAPSFHHHAASTLPLREHAGATLRVIAGRGFGMESPVRVFADTFNVALDLDAGAEIAIDDASIGRATSAGCIRLFQQDIIDLAGRVEPGTRVVVLREDEAGKGTVPPGTPLPAVVADAPPADAATPPQPAAAPGSQT